MKESTMLNASGKKFSPIVIEDSSFEEVNLSSKPSGVFKEVPPKSLYGHDLKKQTYL